VALLGAHWRRSHCEPLRQLALLWAVRRSAWPAGSLGRPASQSGELQNHGAPLAPCSPSLNSWQSSTCGSRNQLRRWSGEKIHEARVMEPSGPADSPRDKHNPTQSCSSSSLLPEDNCNNIMDSIIVGPTQHSNSTGRARNPAHFRPDASAAPGGLGPPGFSVQACWRP